MNPYNFFISPWRVNCCNPQNQKRNIAHFTLLCFNFTLLFFFHFQPCDSIPLLKATRPHIVAPSFLSRCTEKTAPYLFNPFIPEFYVHVHILEVVFKSCGQLLKKNTTTPVTTTTSTLSFTEPQKGTGSTQNQLQPVFSCPWRIALDPHPTNSTTTFSFASTFSCLCPTPFFASPPKEFHARTQ